MSTIVHWFPRWLLSSSRPWVPWVESADARIVRLCVAALVRTMADGPLVPSLAPYTGPYPRDERMVNFSGNFEHVSGSFLLSTDDPAVIDRLNSAIRANTATPDYRAAVAEDRRREEARRERERAFVRARRNQARRC